MKTNNPTTQLTASDMTVSFSICAEDVRSCCIRHDFYTCGTGGDYYKMLTAVDEIEETFDLDKFIEVCRDIRNHTTPSRLDTLDLETICYIVFNDCVKAHFNEI